MNIEKVQSPTFGAVRIYGDKNMPEVVYNALLDSKAVEKFGKRYNADVSYILMRSSKDPKLVHPALIVSDISPVNLFRKIVDKFKRINNDGQFFYVSSHGTKESDLSDKLTKVSEDYLIDKYEGFFKK